MSNRYKGLCRSPEKQTVKPCYSLGNEDAAGREGRTPFWKQRRHSATWCTGKRYCRHPGRHLCLKEVSGCHSTLAQPLSVCLSVCLSYSWTQLPAMRLLLGAQLELPCYRTDWWLIRDPEGYITFFILN